MSQLTLEDVCVKPTNKLLGIKEDGMTIFLAPTKFGKTVIRGKAYFFI